MAYIRKNIKIIFLLVIPVHFYIAQTSILNKHTHFYPNGIVVTHTHPVDHKNGQPINNHNHTKTEICLFHVLNPGNFIVPENPEFDFQNEQNTSLYCIINEENKYSSSIKLKEPRGPPAIIS